MPKEEEEEEEAKRGGAEANVPKPIEDAGQNITIHAVSDGFNIKRVTPNLAQEFLKQLEESKAPNGCIMLPGNLQYWQPCKCEFDGREMQGTIAYNINEPIHLSGPSPGDQSAIIEEEKKEYAETDRPQIDQDDPMGAAQQSSPEETTPPVQKAI